MQSNLVRGKGMAFRIINAVRKRTGFLGPKTANSPLMRSIFSGSSLERFSRDMKEGLFDVVVGVDPHHTIAVGTIDCERSLLRVSWQHSTYEGYFCQEGAMLHGCNSVFVDSLKKIDVAFVLTSESARAYEEKTGKSFFVLPNAIQKLERPTSRCSEVLYCGRLNSSPKGADFLPHLAAKLSEAGFAGVLRIVGDGELKNQLDRWSKTVSLGFDIDVRGFSECVDKYYSNAAVLISLSRWEGFGLSILEGMSYGVPCVCFDNDGPRAFVENGENGFLVEKYDMDDFACKVCSLLDDAVLWNRLSRGAMATAASFIIERQADAFLEVVSEARASCCGFSKGVLDA